MTADPVVLIPVSPLPSALEAEQCLIGAVMFDNAVFRRLGDAPAATEFGEPYHVRLWEIIGGLIGRDRLAEPTSLVARLSADPAYEAFGGLRYLADLVDRAPPAANAPDYARQVKDAARRREIIRIAGEAAQAARDPEQEPFNVITETDAAMSALLVAAAPDGHTMIDARSAAQSLVQRLDHEAETGVSQGVMCGLDCIDDALNGLFPNELIILAGRPSMGKTALARAIAMATARRNEDKTVAFFALEIDRDQISRRNISQLSHEDRSGRAIPYRDMKDGTKMPAEDRARIAAITARVPENFILDDSAVLTLSHVRRRVMTLAKRRPLALIVIDYLQIMELAMAPGMNLTTALANVTKGLKQLSKQVGCPILLLSQLSRKCEERDNKRPQLGDLRDSGAIEQDANTVLFTYRDSYYLEREGPRRNQSRDEHDAATAASHLIMEVICGKSREGPIGTTRQIYYAAFDVIENMGMGR